MNSETPFHDVLPEAFQPVIVTVVMPQAQSPFVPTLESASGPYKQAVRTFSSIARYHCLDIALYESTFQDAMALVRRVVRENLERYPNTFNLLVVASDVDPGELASAAEEADDDEETEGTEELFGQLSKAFVLVVTPTDDDDARNWGVDLNDEYGSDVPQGRRMQVISAADLAILDKAYEQVTPWLDAIADEATASQG